MSHFLQGVNALPENETINSSAQTGSAHPLFCLSVTDTQTHTFSCLRKKVIRNTTQIPDVGSCEMYKDYTVAGTLTSHRDSSSLSHLRAACVISDVI